MCGNVGQKSPMSHIEPYLVELILKLAEMRTPITTSQGLQLSNSLIKGTAIEKELTAWKAHNYHAYKCASKTGKGNMQLSAGYWRSLLR